MTIILKAAYVKKAAAYVKQAPNTDATHHCHWPGCNKAVKPAMWGCPSHWYKLPPDLRNEIWATYKPGQEISKTPSEAYLRAADKVQAWIKAHHRTHVSNTHED